MTPYFGVYRDAAGEYRWRLVAANGEPIAASEGYTSKQSAIHSAARAREVARDARLVDETGE